ncbi:Edc1p TDEL_0D06010 [Torulaspora delbrueckii]|uniref:Enhancer of mRNA-decapping protein 1 n=1 Tax=Torulaspora delbrueckii TaxID=4950 RepID=G8ZU91_TORDE|nr:hypothetical protein TDEL_0D06010 [Torulaspora delbrueckii]CCE92185.1 hypothetical protein TDEL_0D06010 [Torulaspora delbrueckii]
MSSDTKYFNSSRLMSASGKNKTNNIPRLDKKRAQADKKNKVRQETSDIPQMQTLPNGGKPDFGHSSSRRKKRQGSAEKRSSSAGSKQNNQGETDKLTRDLKQLFIKPEDVKTTKDLDNVKNGPKLGANASRSSSGSSNHSSAQQPPHTSGAPVAVAPDNYQNQNSVSSPLLMHPGLFPAPPLPSSAPQQPQMAPFGYPYGNYSLTSAVAPQFMTPQAPLVNPMYPQPPLAQLPLMYKALDIQQQQQHQQYQQSHQSNNQIQPQQFSQFQQPPHQPSPQFHHIPQTLPYLVPPMSSYPKSSESTAVKPLSIPEKPKTNYNQRNKTSTTFAGASFASSDPKVHKLPKPSFTKA